MSSKPESPEFNRGDIQSRLKKIILRDPEDGPKQVALFAARCGLRVLPILAKEDGSGFWFKEEPRKHLVACWRALMIPLCLATGRKVSGKAAALAAVLAAADAARAADAAAAADAADAARAALAAVLAADDADDADDAARAARAAAYASDDARAAARAATIAAILADLSSLEGESKLALSEPVWPSGEEPLEAQTQAFFKACQSLGLDRVVDSYQALLDGGEAAVKVADQKFEVWDALWEEVQKFPDIPPSADTKSSIEPEPETSEKEESATDELTEAKSPEENYLFTPPTSILYESDTTEDRLSGGPLVSALATWIGDKTNNSHITLGLFGNWGAGKSTFLNLLRQQLGAANPGPDQSPVKLPEAITNGELKIIWGEFNAWRYEQCDNIQAGVAQTVVEALKRDLGWGSRFLLALRFAKKQSPWKLSTTSLSIACSVAASAYIWCSGYDATDGFQAGLLAGAVSVPVAVIYLLWKQIRQMLSHPLADQFKTYLRLPQFGEHLGTIPVMQKQVEQLLSLRMEIYSRDIKDEFKATPKRKQKPTQRFVFVVDDLDRCSQDWVVKTLEAIRLIMDIPNVVVILAIDPRIALASLAQKYKGLSEHHGADPLTIARDYLGKVIHAPIVLDEPPKDDIEGYLNHLWDSVGDSPKENQQEVFAKPDTTTISVPIDDLSLEQHHEDKPVPKKDTPQEPGSRTFGETEEATESSAGARSVSSEQTSGSREVVSENESEPQTLTGLSESQKGAFIDWVNRFGFSNPRQIKRLNNAYSLLRLRYPNDELVVSYTYPSLEAGNTLEFPRLVMLLWLEYLHELPAAVRCELLKPLQTPDFDETNWKTSKDSDKPSFVEANQDVLALWEEVKAALADESTGETYLEVRGFVLPAVNPIEQG